MDGPPWRLFSFLLCCSKPSDKKTFIANELNEKRDKASAKIPRHKAAQNVAPLTWFVLIASPSCTIQRGRAVVVRPHARGAPREQVSPHTIAVVVISHSRTGSARPLARGKTGTSRYFPSTLRRGERQSRRFPQP